MSNILYTTFYYRNRIKTVLPLPLWPLPFHGLILWTVTQWSSGTSSIIYLPRRQLSSNMFHILQYTLNCEW